MKIQIKSAGKQWEWSPRVGVSAFTVGRRPGNDIILEGDEGVSNLHLRIDRFLNNWTFTDQMSDNGTIHNGEPVCTGDLNEGDVLKIGGTELRVVSLEKSQFGGPSSDPFRFSIDDSVGTTDDANMPDSSTDMPTENASVYGRRQGQRGDYGRRQGQRGEYQRASQPESPAATSTQAAPSRGQYGTGGPEVATSQHQYSRQAQATQQSQFQYDRTGQSVPQSQHQYGGHQQSTGDVKHDIEARLLARKKAQAKAQARGGRIIAFLVIAVVAIVMVFSAMSAFNDFEDEKERTENRAAAMADNGTSPGNVTSEDVQELQELFSYLDSDSLTRVERLRLAIRILDSPAASDPELSAVRAAANRVKITMESEIRRTVNDRNRAVARDVRQKIRDGHIVSAHNLLTEWRAELDEEPEYEEYLKGFEESHQEMFRQINTANRTFMFDTLLEVDELIYYNKFNQAAEKLEWFVENLRVREDQAARFAREAKLIELRAEAQERGEEPPESGPTDPSKVNAPPTPIIAGFTPAGSVTGMNALSALERRFQDLYREGELENIETALFGHSAMLVAPEEDTRISRIRFSIARFTPAAEEGGQGGPLTYPNELTLHRLPAETKAILYSQLPDLSEEDFLGILHLCFAHGLNDHALLVAGAFQGLHPGVKANLDTYVAARLGIEVPEGGFEVQDGSFVLPEESADDDTAEDAEENADEETED
jgi:hypothetical protein